MRFLYSCRHSWYYNPMSFLYLHKKGFTLIEVVVVAGIIAVLATVVLANMSEAKQKARDTQRVSDLQQVQTAVRVYRDLNSTSILPSYPNGDEIGDGSGFDTDILPFITAPVVDPFNSGSSKYYYNSNYVCNGSSHAVVVALTMEGANKGNIASVCGAGPYAQITNGVIPTAASYVVILK